MPEKYSNGSFDKRTEESEVCTKIKGQNIFHHWPSNHLTKNLLYDSHMKCKMCRQNWQGNTDWLEYGKILPRERPIRFENQSSKTLYSIWSYIDSLYGHHARLIRAYRITTDKNFYISSSGRFKSGH